MVGNGIRQAAALKDLLAPVVPSTGHPTIMSLGGIPT